MITNILDTLYVNIIQHVTEGLKFLFHGAPHVLFCDIALLVIIQRQFINVQYRDVSKVVNMVRIGESIYI